MARLQCPRCNTLVEEVPGTTPVCPNCGFSAAPPGTEQSAPPGTGPAAQPPPPPSPYSATPFGAPPGSYAPQPYPQQPYPPPPAATMGGQKTNGLAVASLVLGLVGICGLMFTYGVASILAIVFGIVGLNQCKARNEQGAGMAIAGIVIGAASLVVGLLVLLFFLTIFGGGPWWWWY